MCTLTWWSDQSGDCEVFFNRDESKTREPALPPCLHTDKGIAWLAPIDPRGGGTWLLVNQFGIIVCLLNWYDRDEEPIAPEGGFRSRGKLVTSLADIDSPAGFASRIREIDARDYPPFRLIGVFPGQRGKRADVLAWEWCATGRLKAIEPIMPLCSSSFRTRAVIEGRERMLRDWASEGNGITPEKLWRFHHGEPVSGPATAPSSWSVRMNRPDAQTWSISRVSVGREEIRFLYEAEPPDLEGRAESFPARMKRVRPPTS
mgnify:CR=1 FL=1